MRENQQCGGAIPQSGDDNYGSREPASSPPEEMDCPAKQRENKRINNQDMPYAKIQAAIHANHEV